MLDKCLTRYLQLTRYLFGATMALTLVIGLNACSSNKERTVRGSEQDVYQRAQGYLKSGSWELSIETLQALEENFPFGTYAEHGQLELIYAHFRAGNHEAAQASAERFIRLHPQHSNVDYAFYMRGIASFYNQTALTGFMGQDVTKRDAGTAKESFNYFSQLLNQFPNSIYTYDAKKRMLFLRNTLARSEINVANYYFKRGAYLAAANRGRWVLENFQETPAIPDALAVMAQAYNLLGMPELSDDAVRVLALNYPSYPALTEDGQFDFQYARAQKRSWVSWVTFGLFDKRPTVKFDTRRQYNAFYLSSKDDIANPPRG